MVFDSEELNHPALLKKVGSVANRQNSLTAERVQIGSDASPFGRTDVSNGASVRARGGFQPRDADRFAIELFILREGVQRMPKRILTDDADIESLLVVRRFRSREPNKFPKIEEIRGLHSIFRHTALSMDECRDYAESDDRRKPSSWEYTVPRRS
jgi:hypothetical protein